MNERTFRSIGIMLAAFAIAAGVALAGQVSFPGTFPFAAGTPIRAAEVNAAFTAVKTAVDDNHTRLTTLETRVSALGDGGLTLPFSATFAGAGPGQVALAVTSAAGTTAIRGAGGGRGLAGEATAGPGVGVFASNGAADGGSALEIAGGITVSGAQRPVFKHTATAMNSMENYTCLDSPFTNGRPSAIVFVTQHFDQRNVYNDNPVGVFYRAGPAQLGDRWCIFNQNPSAFMPVNASFNVLVFN